MRATVMVTRSGWWIYEGFQLGAVAWLVFSEFSVLRALQLGHPNLKPDGSWRLSDNRSILQKALGPSEAELARVDCVWPTRRLGSNMGTLKTPGQFGKFGSMKIWRSKSCGSPLAWKTFWPMTTRHKITSRHQLLDACLCGGTISIATRWTTHHWCFDVLVSKKLIHQNAAIVTGNMIENCEPNMYMF